LCQRPEGLAMSSIRPDPNLLKKHPNAVTVDQLQEKDRFLGTLLGAAAGESLGAPHEGKRAGEIGPLRDITGGGPWAAGEPTDDIDLTLALLRIPERWLKPLRAAAELATLGEQLYAQL
jgi:ADP-ribosylglycohydrolase